MTEKSELLTSQDSEVRSNRLPITNYQLDPFMKVDIFTSDSPLQTIQSLGIIIFSAILILKHLY